MPALTVGAGYSTKGDGVRIMFSRRETITGVATAALAILLAGAGLSAGTSIAFAQPAGGVSLTGGPYPAQPWDPNCWWPDGSWNPDCGPAPTWGPGTGPGQWGPGMMGPGPWGPGMMGGY